MLNLSFGLEPGSPRRILCLGAHADDIEIGCGGTILRLVEENPSLEVYWLVFSANAQRAKEAKQSAGLFLKRTRHKTIVVEKFRDGFFPFQGAKIKEAFERLKGKVSPDVIFTHYRHDLHQDHRVICDLTWNTFRDHLILEYEIPKYDGDLGQPNFFFGLSDEDCDRKIEFLLRAFPTQRGKPWFTEDTFHALLRLRGVESQRQKRYAEAFYCRKAAL
jgi:LmbE family N-acetylglucosaminyl deacetylase